MKLDRVHPGDEVEVDVRGRRFSAVVTGSPVDRTVPILPSVRNVSYRRVRARQILRVIRRGAEGGQLQLGGAT